MKVFHYRQVFGAIATVAVLAIPSGRSATAAITFSTFVDGSAINAVEGQQNTIAFTYAGDKFVGSVYFGGNNLQLYSTDLTGGNVQKFGDPLPTGSGEVVVAASLGQGGFAQGDIYAGPANANIYHYSNAGGAPTLFATTPDGSAVRQIFFDPGSSFGGNMLVTTTSGLILKIDSTGSVTTLASVGEDTEGMDIAPSTWGSYAGSLLVASEGSGALRLISPGGGITVVPSITVPIAETVSFVPLNLGASGNPLEGFYVANYPVDIQKADASQFSGLLGDAIITSEDGSNARIWDLKYDPMADAFSIALVGNLPNQSEDGIFVTAERINDLNPAPEPASIVVWMSLGGIALLFSASKHIRRAA